MKPYVMTVSASPYLTGEKKTNLSVPAPFASAHRSHIGMVNQAAVRGSLWGLSCIGSGAFPRVTPLFLFGLEISSCVIFAILIRNGMVSYTVTMFPLKFIFNPNVRSHSYEWLKPGNKTGSAPPTLDLVCSKYKI